MKINKIKIFFIFFALLIIFVFIFYQSEKDLKISFGKSVPLVMLNNYEVKIEIADEYNDHVQGLSNKKSLAKNKGMFFVFENKQVRSFWMKNMFFPIDIIWLDGNKIVHISHNLKPEGEFPKKNYSSIFPVDNVLEVNAGLCSELGLKIGDEIKVQNL